MSDKYNMMRRGYGGNNAYTDLAPLGSKFSYGMGDELPLQKYVVDVSNQNIPIGGTSLKYALGGAGGYMASENDLINKGYNSIQENYGNALDNGLDKVTNLFTRNEAGGPTEKSAMLMGKKMAEQDYMNAVAPLADVEGLYNSDMQGTMMVTDNFLPKRADGFVPYQEVDTGLNDQNMVASHYADVRDDNASTQYFPRGGRNIPTLIEKRRKGVQSEAKYRGPLDYFRL
tara:strand:+ start:3112 stop:3798 length:687 start_codon:yes stop_codon:yes gene_type:complete